MFYCVILQTAPHWLQCPHTTYVWHVRVLAVTVNVWKSLCTLKSRSVTTVLKSTINTPKSTEEDSHSPPGPNTITSVLFSLNCKMFKANQALKFSRHMRRCFKEEASFCLRQVHLITLLWDQTHFRFLSAVLSSSVSFIPHKAQMILSSKDAVSQIMAA